MVYFSIMIRKWRGALAVALLVAAPLAASAQADVPWNPLLLKSGEPLSELAPARPALEAADTADDVERRIQSISMCTLLSESRGRNVLDLFAGAPNAMIDWVARGVQPPPERCEALSLSGPQDGSIVGRLFASSIQEASRTPAEDLFDQLLQREQRYFAQFHDTDLSTVGVEDGAEDINTDGLMAAQRKLLFDAARKLYFGRLGTHMDSRLRDEALDFGNWRPVDYAVGPAVFGGYLYVRGWEKRFNALGLRWNFGIEPVRRILERFEGSHNDLASAASLEIGMGNFPVKVIVSGGIQDGEALVDFVGIGTSVGKVKQLIAQEFAPE